MTLVVGLVASNGLVIASDSQISAATTRRFEQKVWASADGSCVFGMSGDESTMQALSGSLATLSAWSRSRADFQEYLVEQVTAVLAPIYQRVQKLVGDAATAASLLPTADVIVGCYLETQPHLFHVGSLAQVTHHARGVVTAGSGSQFAEYALTVFDHLREEPPTLHQAKMLAYRIVEDTARMAGPSTAVGGDIQMAEIGADGQPGRLLTRNPPDVSEAVFGWRENETVQFGRHEPVGPAVSNSDGTSRTDNAEGGEDTQREQE